MELGPNFEVTIHMNKTKYLRPEKSRARHLLVSFILTCVCQSYAIAESRILGFNWGSKSGVDAAIESAKADSEKTEKGYLIGPDFWKKLESAQFDADHMAGDGLYFSVHPFDSTRFGPNLMITEIVSKTDNISQNMPGMLASEIVNTASKNLPPVIRYAGSWHVIKRIPFESESNDLQIYIRKPTKQDAEILFLEQQLDTDLAKTLELLKDIVNRKPQEENKSTHKFLTRLKELLVQNSLSNYQHPHNASPEVAEHIGNKLSELLNALKNKKDGIDVFGINLKTLVFQSLLAHKAGLPEKVNVLLFLYEPELAIEMTKGNIITQVVEELPMTKSFIKFLNLRNHLLVHGKKFLNSATVEKIKSLPLPNEKILDTRYIDLNLFNNVSPLLIEDYLKNMKSKANSPEEFEQLKILEKRIHERQESQSSENACRAIYKFF